MNKKAFKKDINSIVKTTTFVEALEKCVVDYEDIYYFIDEWHDGDSTLEINEYLGMTEEQYFNYLKYHIDGLKRMFVKNNKIHLTF